MKKQVFPNLVLLFLALFLLGLAFFFTRQPPSLKEEKTFFQLGTYVKVTIYPARKVNSSLIFSRCQKVMKRVEERTNFFSSSSELAQLNNQKVKKCSPELAELIKIAKLVAQESNGFFDPTIAPLTSLWAEFISNQRKLPPSAKEIEKAQKEVDFQQINVKANIVALGKEQKIDLSGVNKGFAVDKLSEYLKKLPLKGFVIDMTSSIMVWGEKPDKSKFLIALKNPRSTPRKEYLALIPLFSGEYLSTSADNQQFRFFKTKIKGKNHIKRYHHLISPKTGYPAEDFQSVTVITRSAAAYADALSTAIFVMPKAKAIKFIKEKKIKALIVEKNGILKTYNLNDRKIQFF